MLLSDSDVLRHKSYTATVKAASEGRITVVFATLNVADKDRDVTLPGAFGEQVAMFLPAHDWGHPAIGVAKVYEEGNEAIAEIQLYMEMDAAQEWWKSLKGNLDHGVGQEFSYGFTIEDSSRGQMDGKEVQFLKRVKVHEVSPVVVGAGEGTRTLAVKSAPEPEPTLVEKVCAACAAVKAVIAESQAILADATPEQKAAAVAEVPDIDAIADELKAATAAIEEFRKATQVSPKANRGKQLYVDMLLSGSLEVMQ